MVFVYSTIFFVNIYYCGKKKKYICIFIYYLYLQLYITSALGNVLYSCTHLGQANYQHLYKIFILKK